jgi:hypothetical protein
MIRECLLQERYVLAPEPSLDDAGKWCIKITILDRITSTITMQHPGGCTCLSEDAAHQAGFKWAKEQIDLGEFPPPVRSNC